VRLYLFCNLAFGRAALEALAELARGGGDLELVVVLSRKGARTGGGGYRRLRQRWKLWCLRRRFGVPFLGVEDVNEPRFLARLAPGSHGVVVGFNQLFLGAAIARFTTLVNVHPSLLPYYRGPTPSYWTLARGERWSGYTLHRIVERVDAGEILAQEGVEVEGLADPAELDQRIAQRALPALMRWVEHLREGTPWAASRVDARAHYRDPVDYLSFPP
jgi:methionyl-tRNA formyltransferase